MTVDGLSIPDLRAMLAGEDQVFNASVEGMYGLIDQLEDEIGQLEVQKAQLTEALDGLSARRGQQSLFEFSAGLSTQYLSKWRDATAQNAAIVEAAACGQQIVDRDGKAAKPVKLPELKLLHKLSIQLKPAPLTGGLVTGVTDSPQAAPTASPPQKSGGFFGSLKAKIAAKVGGDEPDSAASPAAAPEDPEAQAMCRIGFMLEHSPGNRFVDPTSKTPAEVASVSFGLRIATDGPGTLTANDGDELAAYINMTIHNALSSTANAAHVSNIEAELRSSNVAKRHEEIQEAIRAAEDQRATAQRILDSMILDVKVKPVNPALPGALPCFHVTVTIRQLPDPALQATVEKIVASEEYRRHQATAEKAYAIVETLALHNFAATIDVGVAARPPIQLPDCDRLVLASTRRRVALAKAKELWVQHKALLTDEDVVAKIATEAASEQERELREGKSRSEAAAAKLEELILTARPAVSAVVDSFVLPLVHRTVCPSSADPEPLASAPAAANVYQVQLHRAPRDIVKAAVNEMYDHAAVQAEERAVNTGDAQRGAAVKLAAAKAKVSAALGIYDDLHFDVVPFPYKSSNQKKRAVVLLSRAQRNTAHAVEFLTAKALAIVKEVMAERQAVIDAEAHEGHARSALKDAASAVAAVARAITKLTDGTEAGLQRLSRDTGRYDVTLCACESNAPLVASIMVKPPPSMLATVEASRASLITGIHPAPPSATAFTGRLANRQCRCSVFNAPLQLILGDMAVKLCGLASEHSPLRKRDDDAAAADPATGPLATAAPAAQQE